MMKMDLIIACDRFYKKPHPGRKRLVKFPRKLESRTRGQQLWDSGNQMSSCDRDQDCSQMRQTQWIIHAYLTMTVQRHSTAG